MPNSRVSVTGFTDTEGKEQMVVTKESKLWYCSTADDTAFKVNISKATTPLSAEDKQKYMNFNKNRSVQAAKDNTAEPGTKEQQDEEPSPF